MILNHRPINPHCVRVIVTDGERYVTQDMDRMVFTDASPYVVGELVARMVTAVSGESLPCQVESGGDSG